MLNSYIRYFYLVVLFSFILALTGCGGSSSQAPEVMPPVIVIEPPNQPDGEFEAAVGPPPVSQNTDPQVPMDGLVTLTISAKLPLNTPQTDRIYLSGDFENWSGGGNPNFELIRQSNGDYQGNITLDAGSTIQYKLTRGEWGTEEVSELGRTIGNRIQAIPNTDIQISIEVANWVDLVSSMSNPYTGYWNTETPDFQVSDEKPTIELVDGQTLIVEPATTFSDPGAMATDASGNDISALIQVSGSVNSAVTGDYILSYSVEDSEGNIAVPISRIVRVIDDITPNFTVRAVGTTHSHLGYIEQLPEDYGSSLNKRYPLIIYHHGGGGDASSIDDSPTNSLLTVFSLGGGTASIAMNGDWNKRSPLIALSPQRSTFSPPNFERIDAFVDFAISNYQVDPNRIYMTGHSQGGFVSWRYAVDHPDKVAAIAPIAATFFAGGIPDNICDASVVPIWSFHSKDDNVVGVERGREPINLINQCPPTQPARFTVFNGLGHQSHQYVLTLQGMGNALPEDDSFSENLYEWMMQQSLLDRAE